MLMSSAFHCWRQPLHPVIKHFGKLMRAFSNKQPRGPNQLHLCIRMSQTDSSQVNNFEKSGHFIQNMKSRPKTRKPIQKVLTKCNENTCVTFATAEGYKLTKLQKIIGTAQMFKIVTLSQDITNVICVKWTEENALENKGMGFIFFFREGALTFWNTDPEQIKKIMYLIKPFEIEPYPSNIVHWENEQMNYQFVETKTTFQKNHFEIKSNGDETLLAEEIYAFSNALVMSVKLAHWEHSLDDFIDSIQGIPKELITRKLSYKDSNSVLQMIGELFQIRHQLNLKYNLLDVPDVYWDREDLELLYLKTTRYLNLPLRVKIMNEKLSYCAHIVELLKSHLAEQKSLRIEILIVLLILIEVIFELIHYFVTPNFPKHENSRPE